MQISMKHFVTKIVFNKNPVENTGHSVLTEQVYCVHSGVTIMGTRPGKCSVMSIRARQTRKD